jgi:prevent-host-death family protein
MDASLADMHSPLLASVAFAQAKAKFSEVMDHAVHDHRLQLIDRHSGKDEAVLVSVADLGLLLEGFQFQPKVSVSEGEFVIRLPELNLISGGPDYDEALGELVELAEEKAEDFLGRLDFYMQTDRRNQLPWHLKVAITDPAERRSLFSPAPPTEVPEPAVPA